MGHSTGDFRVACITDIAIDLKAMTADGVRDYIQTRDPELVKANTNGLVTWFTIRRIKTSQFTRYVANGASESDRHRRAFQVAVVSISDFVDMEGVLSTTWAPTEKADDFGYIGDADIDLFSPAQVEEIGQVAYQRSQLNPKAPAFYQPRPSLLALWARRTAGEARVSRLAAALKAKNSSQNTDESPTSPAPSTSPDESGKPTDAPVTESATS